MVWGSGIVDIFAYLGLEHLIYDVFSMVFQRRQKANEPRLMNMP